MNRPRARAAIVLAMVAMTAYALGRLGAGAERAGSAQAPLAARGGGAAVDAGATLDAAAPEPRILLDLTSIELLPDASLQLDLPRGFDDDGAGGRGDHAVDPRGRSPR